jgi:hypothetical protein
MRKLIPKHCLIMVMTKNTRQSIENAQNSFLRHEILDLDTIREDLVGGRRIDIASTLISELKRRIATKLSLGERVVVITPFLQHADDRTQLAQIGIDHGAPIFYLLDDLPAGPPRDMLKGDRIADVVDPQKHQMDIVPHEYSLNDIQSKWQGITVVGDVHGMYQPYQAAISWAQSRNHFIVFLGDSIDYGPDSLDVMNDIYRIVMRGEAEIILGNHERKILRWLNSPSGNEMRLSEGNRVTTDAIKSLGVSQRNKTVGRLRAMVGRSRTLLHWGNLVFSHAAVHPEYWTGQASAHDIDAAALVGFYEPTTQSRKPKPRFEWTDSVPDGNLVFVGHNIRSREHPVTTENKKGGKVFFIDTGSGKGGALTTADLRFVNNTWSVSNFNMF